MSDALETLPDVTAAMRLQYLVEQFYAREAELLDDGRWEEWHALFSPAVTYRMPVRAEVDADDPSGGVIPPGGLTFFEEDWVELKQRVRRLRTGRAWAEQPRSRTRHFVTNVRVERQGTDRLAVRSNFLLSQNRRDAETHVFAGRRDDVLEELDDPGSFLIASRTIILDHGVVDAKALSVFF